MVEADNILVVEAAGIQEEAVADIQVAEDIVAVDTVLEERHRQRSR